MTRPRPSALVALLAGLLLAAAPGARADEAADIERLINGGRGAEALARVERALADQPRDAQLRFLHGVVLADAGRADEATAVFVALTQDHPELAEPYNNLAVLHAARGRYAEARAALEAAIRNQPGYAVAHENLGDIQARLAAESYQRARELDPRRRGIDAKIAALHGLLAPAPAPSARAPAAASAASAPGAAR